MKPPILLAALSCALAITSSALAADTWPARPIRLIAPFPAGSSVDAAARVITPHLAAQPRFNALHDFTDLLLGLEEALT